MAAPAAPSLTRCTAGVCSAVEPRIDGHALVVENRGSVVVTVEATYTELRNVAPSAPSPLRRELAAGERAEIARFRALDPRAPTEVRARVEAVKGSARSVHDPSVRYAMPFGGDAPRCLAQGMDGGFTHVGANRYAFDFEMPEGTPVLAAREGVVLTVEDGHERGGPDPRFLREANTVVIVHADDTFGRYVHLRKGVAVAPGQRVAKGARLGDSGRTGYASAPHLHFDVGLVETEVEGYTIPVRFEGPTPEGVSPAQGACLPPARETSR